MKKNTIYALGFGLVAIVVVGFLIISGTAGTISGVAGLHVPCTGNNPAYSCYKEFEFLDNCAQVTQVGNGGSASLLAVDATDAAVPLSAGSLLVKTTKIETLVGNVYVEKPSLAKDDFYLTVNKLDASGYFSVNENYKPELVSYCQQIGGGEVFRVSAVAYTQDREPSICTPNWQCNDWGTCSESRQFRTCNDANNCGVIKNKPEETQGCIVTCTPDWTCTEWSKCEMAHQSRTCVDRNNCGVISEAPASEQACTTPTVVDFVQSVLPTSGEPAGPTGTTTVTTKTNDYLPYIIGAALVIGLVIVGIIASSGGKRRRH